MTAYYNEFCPQAAAWIRELITMGMIAPGEVDERSVIDVQPEDLRGYTQHHFFAGIGVWSYALRRAGWSDSTPVCTASLPCQPFSAAGKRKGKDDERHLLPHFIELVKRCDFPIILGEQVPPAIKQGWLDDLCDEMERENYTVGAAVLTAAGAGAPHIRQRIYWTAVRMAYTVSNEEHKEQQRPAKTEGERGTDEFGRCGMDNPASSGMGNTQHDGHAPSQKPGSNGASISECAAWQDSTSESEGAGSSGIISGGIDWLYCRDERYRPIKSGITPLVDGSARGMGYSSDSSISPNSTSEARVMRLKGYGNAIQADTATLFITAVMESIK